MKNEQEVKQGQPLAFLQSTANHQQVLALEEWVKEVEPFIINDSFEILFIDPLPAFNQLGEIQTAYQDFQNTTKETLQIFFNGYYQQKKKALLKDLAYLSSLQNNNKKQLQLMQQDFELQQQEYHANESLAKDKVIAPLELNQNKSKVIGKEQSLEQANSQIINNDLSEHGKRKEILDLQKYVIDQKQKFRSELFNLKSKIEEWEQQYVIIAPEKGKVLFSSFFEENQLLSMGQEMFYVQPPGVSYYGQLMAPQSGLGKIKPGQKVLIRVESYPSTEFGYITGKVSYISNIPTAKDSFLIRIDLPYGMETNYHAKIRFRNNLAAEAEVITDNRRLFDRFVGQLRDLGRR